MDMSIKPRVSNFYLSHRKRMLASGGKINPNFVLVVSPSLRLA